MTYSYQVAEYPAHSFVEDMGCTAIESRVGGKIYRNAVRRTGSEARAKLIRWLEERVSLNG